MDDTLWLVDARHAEWLLARLHADSDALGLTVSVSKARSQTLTAQVEFVGYQVDGASMRVSLTTEKRDQLLSTLDAMLRPGAVLSGRDVEVVTGRLLHAAEALWVLKPLLGPLLELCSPLRRGPTMQQRVAIPGSCRPVLQVLREVVAANPGRCLPRSPEADRDFGVWCDASTTGFGAVLRRGRGPVLDAIFGAWPVVLAPGDMPTAELAVVGIVVEEWGDLLRGSIVTVNSDSSSAVRALRKGRSTSSRMSDLLLGILR